MTKIEDEAFTDCYSLTSVSIPKSVTSIGSRAFYRCYKLSGITIPANVESIGDEAFLGCEKLSNVTIPADVKSIGEYAFYFCKRITEVTIPKNVERIGNGAFYGCEKLTDVYFGGTKEQWNTLKTSIGINNDPLLSAKIHFSTSASAGVLTVEKEIKGEDVLLNYSFKTEKTGKGTVCAIQYVNGQMVGVKTIEVDLAEASGKAEFADKSGVVYKILLVDSGFAPVCSAWTSE